MNILVVDDEKEIADVVELYLQNDQYKVFKFYNGQDALDCINSTKIDLAILDIMLPDIDGFQILKQIRQKYTFPVIMLTAKTEYMDKITGLTLGADDYISKPFSLREVIARVKAVLRRTVTPEAEKAPEQITYQTLVIDITKKKVSIDGEEVALTKKEFEILFLLLQNKGRVFSREDILARVWSDEVYVLDRTIDVNITRLRKKIGIYGKRIVTRLGYGYCFETE